MAEFLMFHAPYASNAILCWLLLVGSNVTVGKAISGGFYF